MKNLVWDFHGCDKWYQSRMAGEMLKERVEKLEQLMGEWNCEEGTVTTWATEAMNKLRVQRVWLKSTRTMWRSRWCL